MDAIVRPQLTIKQSISLLIIKVCCVFATGKSFREISGMGEWAPPLGIHSSPTPPGLGAIAVARGVQQMGEGGRPITSHFPESMGKAQDNPQTRINARD